MRNERWSSNSEIQRVLTREGSEQAGGPVLLYRNNQRWVYGEEGHTLMLGVSGSGKSRRGTIPMIRSFIETGESFIVVDPKGEIHHQTECYAAERYKIHVIDFRHIFESECWNPLAAPCELFCSGDPVKRQVALEMVDELAHSLYVVSERADPFWPESARSLFVGAAYALMEYGVPNQVSMAGIYRLIAEGEERFGGSTVLKEFTGSLDRDSVVSMMLQSYVSTAADTRAGIRSTFLEGLSMFARSDGLISMLGSDSLHINHLDGFAPTGIYIILPDENPIFDKLAGVLVSQLLGHYVRLAQDKYGGTLPRRLNVCLEELGNIGNSIRNLPHLMSAGRSRNIRCQLVLQSLSQLETVYGPGEASTIRSNADVLISFRTNHWETLTELSHKCGDRDVKEGERLFREPLITQSQLAAMGTGQALIMISGAVKYITWLPDYGEMYDCRKWKAPRLIIRQETQPCSVFDMKEYVKKIKLKSKLTKDANVNPFMQASHLAQDEFTLPGED